MVVEGNNGMKKTKSSKYAKATLAVSVLAMIIAIINIFFQVENLRTVILTLAVIVFLMNFWNILTDNFNLMNENLMLKYEIDELRYSYIQMGQYVDKFEIPELHDMDLRIETELNDIEVKKSWFAESHGIKGK